MVSSGLKEFFLRYCPTAHHVLSNKHMDDEHRPPQRLSLLLPTDVFNGTMEMFRAGGAPMVEVSAISPFSVVWFLIENQRLHALFWIFSQSFLIRSKRIISSKHLPNNNK